MGRHTDKFMHGRGDQLRLYIYANLAVAGTTLIDHFIFHHPYALQAFALLILLINGVALWQQNSDFNRAAFHDEREEREAAQREKERDARLRARGLKLW
jgi:hypothetical protein